MSVVIFMVGSGAWADDQTGTNIITHNEFESLRIKAEKGNAEAEFNLGKCYHEGLGVKQDKAEALKWTEKAAAQGIPQAQMMAGLSYWLGMDVKMDEAKGVKWFEKAAEQGEAGGFYYLGAAYYLGKGVKQDYVESYKWTLLFKESGPSVIPSDTAGVDFKLADLEGKMTAKQIAKGKQLAKEEKMRLSKTARFTNGP